MPPCQGGRGVPGAWLQNARGSAECGGALSPTEGGFENQTKGQQFPNLAAGSTFGLLADEPEE
eukprot:7050332-Alexandrium_andersonii.AAC.1